MRMVQEVMQGKPYIFKCGGNELAKVLYHYGLIPEARSIETKIVCPFHNDENPSMVINLERGSYYCFGCGASGDAFHFVEQAEKETKGIQLIIKFFKILNSDEVKHIRVNRKMLRVRKQSKELYDIACDYYYGLSKIDWNKRKSKEVVEARDYMVKRGFTTDVLNECEAKITYNKQYAIIFPMLDNGEFKGWVCRTTLPEVEKKRKYLYSEGFMRRNTLVGNYANCETVFIVEGYMDRLKFLQYGVKNVVAILGWKMSVEQERKLKSAGINHVISALDNDECGRKGTEYLKGIFRKVTRFKYKKGFKDPGEMSKKEFDIMYKKTMMAYEQDKKKIKGKVGNKNGLA